MWCISGRLTGVVVGGLVEVGGEEAHDEEERQPEDPDSQEVRTPDEWLAPKLRLQVVLAVGAESKSAVPADADENEPDADGDADDVDEGQRDDARVLSHRVIGNHCGQDREHQADPNQQRLPNQVVVGENPMGDVFRQHVLAERVPLARHDEQLGHMLEHDDGVGGDDDEHEDLLPAMVAASDDSCGGSV